MSLSLSLPVGELCSYVVDQLNHLYPDPKKVELSHIRRVIDAALSRLEICFAVARPQRFHDRKAVKFNHLYSDQYLVFLWLLSNEVHLSHEIQGLADKIYCCNKTLHAFDCAYSNRLPAHFMVIHGVGTVLGNA